MNRNDLINTLKEIFSSGIWPRPLHILQALSLCESGTPLTEATKAVGTTQASVKKASETSDPVSAVLGLGLNEISDRYRRRATQILGQLLLGRCAEIAFEQIYKAEMHSEEFELRDLREGRTDTDYRLYNGRGRPIYRVNIKFHGSQFRRAPEMVGLHSSDCFALATYKIHSAIEKQKQEGLPYFFAIVGVPNLTGAAVGSRCSVCRLSAARGRWDSTTAESNAESSAGAKFKFISPRSIRFASRRFPTISAMRRAPP